MPCLPAWFDDVPAALIQLPRDGGAPLGNTAARRLLGDDLAHDWVAALPPADPGATVVVRRRAGGSLRWLAVTRGDGEQSEMISLADVTADLALHAARHEELDRLAHRDSLTGLYNRRGFTGAGGRLVAEQETQGGAVSLLYVDVEGLKPVNDAFGHEAGDRVLTLVAAALSTVVRDGDVVARLGGDEFAALLRGPAGPVVRARVQTALDRLRAQHDVPGPVRATVGVVVAPAGRAGLAELVARADADMYARRALKAAPRRSEPSLALHAG